MADTYRKILRENLTAAMRYRDWSISKPPPIRYMAGPNKGKKVSARTLQYMIEPYGPSPKLDTVAAVAVALGLHPWELLTPDLSLGDRPALTTKSAVEAEVSRRVAARMQELQGQVARLLEAQSNGAGGRTSNGGSSTNIDPDNETPGKGKGDYSG